LNYVQLKPILNGLLNRDYIKRYEKDDFILYVPTFMGQQLLTKFIQMDKSKKALAKRSEKNLLNILTTDIKLK
jgi:hypothetical protein